MGRERTDRRGRERERERERNGADGEGDDSDGVRALGLRAGAGEQARTPRQERISGERKGVKERKKERKKHVTAYGNGGRKEGTADSEPEPLHGGDVDD